MVILQKTSDGIVIGRTLEIPIACFMFNSWNGTLNTVAIDKSATDDETELLCKIAYRYSEKIWKSASGTRVHPERLNIFQESFDEYDAKPEKELVDKFYFTKGSGKFIKNAYDSSQEAVDEIVKQVKDVSDISVSIDISEKVAILERTFYTVSLADDSAIEFTFWNSNGW